MGFFGNLISGFKEAVKAGQDFNPKLDEVMKKLEELHGQGHLDDVVFKAEEAYKKEHEAYAAKGIHTNAEDSQMDVRALAHFMEALKNSLDSLDPSIQGPVKELLGMKDKMEHILGKKLNI